LPDAAGGPSSPVPDGEVREAGVESPVPEARPEGAAEAPVLFVSYSHRDDHWMRKLRVHLTPLKRKRECEVIPWDDSEIEPGAGWEGRSTGRSAGHAPRSSW
jgi:hypothetical protein